MLKEVKRETIYDYIRVFACLCVIGIHTTDILILGNKFDSTWWVGIFIQGIVRIGLPLFMLLSGVLALNKKEEQIGEYYFKKFLKVVIPFVIYSLIYIFVYKYNYSFSFFKLSNIFSSFKDIISGNVYYHFWYFYVIIGIYLCVPFFRKMCCSLNIKECRGMLYLIFFISFIKYFLPSFGIQIGISDLVFDGWVMIFLLGYLINKEFVLKNYKIIYVLGISSFLFNIISKRYFLQLKNLDDLSVTMFLQVMMVFLFFYINKDKICKNEFVNNIIYYFSKYSWSIFLIHVYVLNSLREVFYIFRTCNIIGSILLVIFVFFISFLFAYVIDNIIVKNIQKLTEKIYRRFMNIR